MKSGLVIYLCIVLFSVVYANENGQQDIIFTRNQDEELVLNCSLPTNTVQWLKNGTKVELKEGVVTLHENGVHYLKFSKPKSADIGTYTCESTDSAKSAGSIEFRVSMAPHVNKFTSSANVVEGERLRVVCTVSGYPIPTVTWSRAGEGENEWKEVEPDNHFGLELNPDGIEGATLVINEAKMEDRDDYMCKAINDLGVSNSTVLIRVIDKYAALWPFLGICAEVIVLCAVIFIFERRRTKKQFEESDNEQNNSKHVVNAKDSEVRNRK